MTRSAGCDRDSRRESDARAMGTAVRFTERGVVVRWSAVSPIVGNDGAFYSELTGLE